ncbi:MAG TPA: hypothetical protein DDZ51_23375 [Planctomycetaceae bacterium]|nr:hypothetical protein [Planctomycetaceae bacterium]
MKRRLQYIAAVFLVAMSIYGIDRWIRNDADSPSTLASTATRVRPSTCFECHNDIATKYAAAPHNSTLRRGDDPEVIAALAGKSAILNDHRHSFVERGGQLFAGHSAMPTDRRVDWVFGSGHHAMTPVAIDVDPDGHPRLTQFNASLLADGELGATPGLGVTVGQRDPAQTIAGLPPTHGKISDPAETRRCFGCHVSGLPQIDGRIDLNNLIANIDCNRCHPGATAHAQSGGVAGLTLDWANLTPLEAINRCGECHRRADEFTPDELGPDVLHLVRFAPVGMAMSRCFVRSQTTEMATSDPRFARFDCVTCHDPHAPASTNAAHYNKTCFACHDFGKGGKASVALQGPGPHPGQRMTSGCTAAGAESSCVSCHMPKKESGEGLFFTDHWIRVHRR